MVLQCRQRLAKAANQYLVLLYYKKLLKNMGENK